MSYIDGFVGAVPIANKQAYIEHVNGAAPLFYEYGIRRIVECWQDDIPAGEVTDYRRAVQAKDDEAIIFSWIEYDSRAKRDQVMEKCMSDPRMHVFSKDMPFDGRRMILGGFEVLNDCGKANQTGYIDGLLAPVLGSSRQAYLDFVKNGASALLDYGALRVMDAWGDDVPDGKVTDFKRAVKAESDEVVVFSWVEWPTKEARDAAWEKIMSDPRMNMDGMPFDPSRWVHGGFIPIVDI